MSRAKTQTRHRMSYTIRVISLRHSKTKHIFTSERLNSSIALSQGVAKCSEGSATDRYDPYFVLCMLFAFCSSSNPYDCRLYSWSNPCDCFHLFFCTAWAFEAWQISQASNIWNHGFGGFYRVVLCGITGFTALCNLSVFSFAINCGILEHVELGQFRALPSVTLE